MLSGIGKLKEYPREVGRRPAYVWLLVTCLIFVLLVPAYGQTSVPVDKPEKSPEPILSSPARVIDGPNGTLLVTDYSAAAIFAVDRETLETLWTLPIDGSPLGIATLGNFAYVANETTANVEVFDFSRKHIRFVYSLGHPSRSPQAAGYFQRPGEIAVDRSQGQVFVLDLGDKSVKSFDSRGNFIHSFLVKDGLGRTLLPSALAIDEGRKQVVVSDYGDPNGFFGPKVPARILFYSYTGTYLGEISGDGRLPGSVSAELQFSRPQGLAVDELGLLYMAEALLGQVYVFDRNQILDADSVGLAGKLPGVGNTTQKLRFPLDVFVDSQANKIFVTNYRAGKIEVFPGVGGGQ